LIYTQALLTKMVAKCTSEGQSIAQTIGWASNQLEAYTMM